MVVLPGRRPDVIGTTAAWSTKPACSIGHNEHFQPVSPDGSAGVIEGSAQQPWPTQETAPLSTAGTPD